MVGSPVGRRETTDTVHRCYEEQAMIDEQLEFQISQYCDGTLAPAERAALEVRLATDAKARELLDEYRRLDATLHQSMPVPQINWDRLASHLSAVVAREQEPVQVYRLPVVRWRYAAGLAAAVALVAGIFFFARNEPTQPQIASSAPRQSIAIVMGPQIATPSEPPVEQITIGPAPAMIESTRDRYIAEIIVSRPTTVLIASSGNRAQDTSPTLY